MRDLLLSKVWMRLMSVILTVSMVTAFYPQGKAAAADDADELTSSGYTVDIQESVSSNGFAHPGVGLTKETLENMRSQVLAQKEPWYSYYKGMIASAQASKTVSIKNQSTTDPTKPAANYFNSQGIQSRFISDALLAYTQSIMYFITGDVTYRANAMQTIRIWSQMDPAQYAYYTDAHIHTGIPLNRMVTAAEILRYTSSPTAELEWTEQDTASFTNNLINPVIETFQHSNNYFMNQHTYPLMGAMAGYIFTNNKERYNEAVEWFTVNKTANDQGFNGSIRQMFRMVDTNNLTGEPVTPHVQHLEMGRDQAHGGGDLTNAVTISRMLLAQGTKVDPEDGTVSDSANAVGPFEFLDDRILATADYFWQYMLGYDTPWTPVAYAISPDGTIRDTYTHIASGYRGRFNTANFWDLYYYYTYVKGENVAEKAPYYYEAFKKRTPLTFYYGGSLNNNWDNVDGGGDFWLYIPKEAESEGAANLPKQQTSASLLEVEERYTSLDNRTETVQEGDTSFVRMNAAEAGTKIAFLSSGYAASQSFGLKIRTNGTAALDMLGSLWILPDTKGQWTYFTVTGTMGDIAYLTLKGAAGSTVDIDHINAQAGAQLTPPVFKSGRTDLNVFTYAGTALNLDLSAEDAGSTDVITYELQASPEGSVINDETGAFTWKPEQAGTSSFVVAASDGITVTTKKVTVVTADDRASAVEAAITPYESDEVYVSTSLAHYQSIYDETMSLIGTASDEDFNQQLGELRNAAESLDLTTPLRSDGSMHYSDVVYWSSWGNDVTKQDDLNYDTGGYYGLALGTPPHLYHILDFGPDYKVSANKFGFQSNIFADRLANSTVYGSNNGEYWTRLTPGVTRMTQEFQTLDVDAAYQNEKYRFIKLEMIQPLPDVLYGVVRNFLELPEFRIYGTRYEIDNKLESVSMSSDQSVNGKISTGDTVKLNIQAREVVQNVKVTIQGQDAVVSKLDDKNWTAEAKMEPGAPTGPVKFTIDYQKIDGTNGDTAFSTTDSSSLFLVDGTTYLDVTKLAKVTASDPQWPGTGLAADQVGYLLFDGDSTTYGDLTNSTGTYTVDFGEGVSVELNEIVLMPRSTHPARMNGLIIQGSNDNVNWTNLTKPVASSQANKWLDISKDQLLEHQAYRYFRLYNSTAWSGNVAEVELHGTYTASAEVVASTITSLAVPAKGAASLTLPKVPGGYSISLTSTAPEGIIASDGTITQPDMDTIVSVVLTVTSDSDGSTANTVEIPVVVPGKSAPIKIDVTRLATVTASDNQYVKTGSGLTKEQVGYLLFDGNTTTYGDLITGPGSYYTIDLGTNSSINLTQIKLFPRATMGSRLNGLVVQGSNDNTSWTNLTNPISGALSNTWTDLRLDKIVDHKAYRFLRLYNAESWYGNLAEVDIFGYYDYDINSKIVAPDSYTQASYYNYLKEIDNIKDAYNQPGADKMVILDQLLKARNLLVSLADIYPKITVSSSMSLASSVSWDGTADAVTNGWRAFDGDTTTSPDTKTASGWARVDLGAGNEKVIGSIRFIPRSGNIVRINGAQIQGSNDGTNYETLFTINGITDLKWYSQLINRSKAYRYLRYNTSSGYANIGDIEFHEKVADRTLLKLFIEEAKAVDIDPYTDDSVAAFQTELMAAEEMFNNPFATQEEIDTEAAKLRQAQSNLEKQPVLAKGAPGKAVLSDNNGYDTGIKDGDYFITMNLWWGDNGTEFKLYENGELIKTQKLTDNSPEAQTFKVDVTGKANGMYTYTCELINSFGTTACDPHIVTVTEASPGKPILSNDNWDGDGEYKITMNMWWGTNASEYRLYENGQLVDTQSLTTGTPNAQSAITSLTGREPGEYEYEAVLVNAAGESKSEKMKIMVK
ncbi:OmpL47-type beta-barrel domain-containing protein [Paenibacillus sp. YAF4_2]|uniref:OmpL47-type beta-barrel domain-containing protein n=1 Tax=Paenibacillus sp. YAF4_2 TaxID=3233085 RepID=UPI003F96AFA7